MSGRAGRRLPSLDAVFGLLFVGAGFVLSLDRLNDNSFFWHLRTGHLILDDGIPRDDVFSFTAPGVKWVAQSWLAEVLYALADDLAGGFGIRLFMAVCGAALAGLLWWLGLQLARDRARVALILVPALLALRNVWSERPLFFGLLAFAAVVSLVELPGARLARAPAVYVALPVVFWLWGNLHGTYSLGFAYLVFHLFGAWLDGTPPWAGRSRELLVAGAVSGVALVANPYGIDLLLFPFRLLGRSDVLNDVVEWNSPNFRDLGGQVFLAWVVIVVVVLARARPRASWRDVVVAVGFVALALWAARNIGLAVIATIPVVARAVAGERRPEERTTISLAFAGTLVALVALFAVNASGQDDYDLERYPVAALRALEDDGLLGRRLFTTDAWAGYVILEHWPDQHVFMDDRYDTYPRAIDEAYDELADLEPEWRDTLRQYDIEVVVWPAERALTQALRLDPDWEVVAEDEEAEAVVLVRSDVRA